MPNTRKIESSDDSSSKVGKNLRLIYGGKASGQRGKTSPAVNSESSVSPSLSLPNGARNSITEHGTEKSKQLIDQYRLGSLSLRQLYSALRALWGKQVFEGSRHCFENMKQRAKNEYATLDPRFEELANFLYFMGPRPDNTASIHRKDNAKGYCPENCVWADKKTQSRERTNSISLTFQGETRPLTEWAEMQNQPPAKFYRRKNKGWTDEEIITGTRDSQQDGYIPPDAPWPPIENRWELWEKPFREGGGKTADERYAYAMYMAEMWIKKYEYKIELYSWEDYYDPTEDELKGLREFNDKSDKYILLLNNSREELIRRNRSDLIDNVERDRYGHRSWRNQTGASSDYFA